MGSQGLGSFGCGWQLGHTFLACQVRINRFLLRALLSCVSIQALYAQIGCGTEAVFQRDEASNKQRYEQAKLFREQLSVQPVPGFRLQEESSVVTIPVVVHVIHHDVAPTPSAKSSTNISDDQIYSQLRVLNEDFRKKDATHGTSADIGISFCLASLDPQGQSCSGINRIYHAKSVWSQAEEETLKQLSYWPSDQYLNIWVASLNVEEGFGYARYPTGSTLADLEGEANATAIDGVVVHYQTFGTVGSATYPYHLGHTTTHEIGHWLGLRHVWGDEACGDDFVADTPWDEAPNKDNDCDDFSTCTGSRKADNTGNYLDFSPDRCMNHFTKGQKERMWKALWNSPRRKALFASQGCSGEPKQSLQIKVFPMPVVHNVQVELYGARQNTARLIWYNHQGMKLKEDELACEYQQVFAFDLSTWPQGMYFLQVESALGEKMVKIFVEH